MTSPSQSGRNTGAAKTALQLVRSPPAAPPAANPFAQQQQHRPPAGPAAANPFLQQKKQQQQQQQQVHELQQQAGQHQKSGLEGEEQEEGQRASALDNALSRLGGVLDNAGLLAEHALSQYEAPDDPDASTGELLLFGCVMHRLLWTDFVSSVQGLVQPMGVVLVCDVRRMSRAWWQMTSFWYVGQQPSLTVACAMLKCTCCCL